MAEVEKTNAELFTEMKEAHNNLIRLIEREARFADRKGALYVESAADDLKLSMLALMKPLGLKFKE